MRRLAPVAFASLALCAATACGSSGSSTTGAASLKSPTGPSKTVDADGKRAVVKESAIALFEEAAKLARSNPQAAIDGFKKAAKEEDNFAEAWYNIGVLEQKLGHTKEAKEAYNKAIDMRPDMSGPYINIAKMLVEEGNDDEAEKYLLIVVDEKTGIDTAAEVKSVVVSEENMGSVALASSAFGQTSTVTPIEMITAFAAAINGGKLVEPY